jgi:hypothetical protein
MQALQDLEILEIEILELLNSIKVLDYLYFGGGTMLRLCHNLNRYSTDLDFWLDKKSDPKSIYAKCKESLSTAYKLTDSANKKFTLLFELKSTNVNRSLKIEIRKEQTDFDWERKIAFSKFTNKQVMVKSLTLDQMMNNKIEALLSRKLIRDAFDIEFLLMRGIDLPVDKDKLSKALQIINNFKEQEYKVTLGSILEEKDRKFYLENRFKLLKEELTKTIKELK